MKRKLLQLVRRFGYDVTGYHTYRGKPDPERLWEDDPDFLKIYVAIIGFIQLSHGLN